MRARQYQDLKLINIIGIDGCGKTTLAQNLINRLQGLTNFQYKYCQYFPKLLLPMKLIARFLIMRKTDQFKDYCLYKKTKDKMNSRCRLLGNMYAVVWIIDYILQVILRATIPIWLGKKYIVDRYIYDVAINLCLTRNSDISYTFKLISLLEKFTYKPDRVILVDLPEEEAYRRKDDIPDIEYLKERRECYLLLADKYSFEIVNGLNDQRKLVDTVLAILWEG